MAFNTGGRKCKFESLETRQMMAGDVVGRVHAGTLTLKGDNFNNGIIITAGAVPNSIDVTGITPAGSTPTNINGLSNGTVTFLNVIHGLKVSMKGGNDTLTIDDVNINGRTTVKMGAGVDTVLISDSTLCKGLNLYTSQDADDATISNTIVEGKAKIRAGGDCDSVTIEDSDIGQLDVNLNEDNDTLSVANTQVVVGTTINGGKGINSFVNGISNFFGAAYLKKNLNG